MASPKKIPGGFYIKARCIQESEIADAPPHVREIWDWFLMNANHKDYKNLKRGQLLTTYKDIRDGLSWYIGYRKCQYSKGQCETAMKWLKNATMVTTAKTTRGMIVTVLNYDKFQNIKNYENHKETYTRTTTEPQWHDRINKNEKNERMELNKGSLKTPSCPLQKITDLFHSILPTLPTVNLDETLKTRIRARWKADKQRQSLDWWSWYFQGVSECDFLMGKKTDFAATLHWLTGPQNMSKVLNGQYLNRKAPGRNQSAGQEFLEELQNG